jgi:HEAT repeat protein
MWRVMAACVFGILALAMVAPAVQEKIPANNGKTALEWISLLQSAENVKKRQAILEILGLFQTEHKVIIPALIKTLKTDSSEEVRANAAQLLTRMALAPEAKAPDAAKAAKALADTVAKKDESPDVRRVAAKALGGKFAEWSAKDPIGPVADVTKDAIIILADALADKDAGVQAAAGAALKDYGKEALRVVPQLLAAAKNAKGDLYARIYSIQILTKNSDQPGKIVPLLMEVLKEKDAPTILRQTAVDGLADFFRDAQPATDLLIDILKDGKSPVLLRQSAAQALGKIQPNSSQIWPTVKVLMNAGEPAMRVQAIRLAGKLCQAEKELIPSLIKRCDDDNVDVQIAAIQELGELGGSAKSATATLQRLIDNTGRDLIREAAQNALKKIMGNTDK